MKILKFALILFAIGLLQCKNSKDDIPPVVDPVLISILDLSVDEGSDYTNLTIELQLDAAAEQQITANISTSDGTAESNKDYISFENQPVVFAPGETEKTYEITIAGDLIFEEDEHFEVTIVSVSGPATINNATARVDLLNDDVMGIQEVSVSLTCDWDALVNLTPGSEAPYEVMNFGQPSNVPNAEYTSVSMVNDTIYFNPKFSSSGDTILYSGLFFDHPEWPTYFDLVFEYLPGDSVHLDIKVPILSNDVDDLDVKYNLIFMLGTSDQGRLGPFMIDPKIRIPSQ